MVRINMLSTVWEWNSLKGCLCLGRGGCELSASSWEEMATSWGGMANS